jgi:hypothetical protein
LSQSTAVITRTSEFAPTDVILESRDGRSFILALSANLKPTRFDPSLSRQETALRFHASRFLHVTGRKLAGTNLLIVIGIVAAVLVVILELIVLLFFVIRRR